MFNNISPFNREHPLSQPYRAASSPRGGAKLGLPPALRGVAERSEVRGCAVGWLLTGSVNRTQFNKNVGDDAHIVPQPRGTSATR